MINWLVSLGVAADIAKNIIDIINAGFTVASILSILSTAGLGAGVLTTLKGILKKKGAEAAIA